MTSSVKPHGFVTKGLHWLSAGLVAFGYYKGLDDVSELADSALLNSEVLFASALGVLFLIRLIWTKYVGGVTRLPLQAPRWEHKASKIVHFGLYASVFAIVLSGLGIAFAYTTPFLTGLFLTTMIGLHEVVLTIMPLLLIAHITGALWHKFIRHDGVMESMTGSWRPSRIKT